MKTPILSLASVSKHFGGIHVLQHLDLAVPAGSIFGLIGPNGAGKTTVFNLITGLIQPDAGRIHFDGHAIAGMAPYRITRFGMARTFQNIRLFGDMTLRENVMVGMHARLRYGLAGLLLNRPDYRRAESHAWDRAMELLSWMRLDDKADLSAEHLSYGEQRRLELARALATEPKLLLLDEPVAGMNPAEKADLMTEIGAIRDRGYSIFMIEHDMQFVMGLCEQVAVLNFGRLIATGTPDVICRHPDVLEAYLGRDDEAAEGA